MTAFDTTRTTYGSASIASRLIDTLNICTAAFIGWNDARMTRNALAGLSDRELEDIGLSRSDIEAVAQTPLIR